MVYFDPYCGSDASENDINLQTVTVVDETWLLRYIAKITNSKQALFNGLNAASKRLRFYSSTS